jgi:hypothetical protein
MALRFKLQLVLVADDEQVSVDDLVVLDEGYERLEHLGLTLAEAKTLLLERQRQILTRQIGAFLASRVPCPVCGRARGSAAVRASIMGRHPAARWSSCCPSTLHPSCGISKASGRRWSRTG